MRSASSRAKAQKVQLLKMSEAKLISVESKSDFIVQPHDSTWTIIAKSEAAKKFTSENFAAGEWQGTPERFSIGKLPAIALCLRLVSGGFKFEQHEPDLYAGW